MTVHPGYERDETTTHVVTWWHIPGGCDYTNAYVFVAYIWEEGYANRLAKEKGDMPPEMATVCTIAQWDAAQARRPDSCVKVEG